MSPRDQVYAGPGDLRHYGRILWRRKWYVVACFLAALVATVGVTKLHAKQYQASAEVLTAVPNGGAVDVTNIATEIGILESTNVRSLALQKYPDAGDISASQIGESSLVAVTADDPSPTVAAQTANAWADAYVQYRQSLNKTQVLAPTRVLQAQIDTLQHQISGLESQLAVRPQNGAASAESGLLSARLNALLNQQVGLQSQLQQVREQVASTTLTPAVLSPATAPTGPLGTSKSKTLILGGAAGLLVGILLAFLFEYLDDSIRATEHVQEELAEQLVMLGVVPEFPRRADASPLAVAGLRERTSTLVEPYRAIRTALHFVGADGPGSLIEVIAPSTGEGATTTAANLAVLLARAGRAVALVDANLRSPGVHSLFGLDNRIGLTSIMIGDVELHDALCTVQGPDKLVVLPAGPEPPNPSELIASPRFASVMRSLCDDGATVVVDCPPLLSASDGLVVGATAKAVVLVTSARTGSRKRVRRAVALLRQANAPLVGVVLNRAGKHSVGYEPSGAGSVLRPATNAASRDRLDLSGDTEGGA